MTDIIPAIEPFLPIGRPHLDQQDLARLAEPIRSGWVMQGPLVEEFERGFSERLGTEHAVAFSSCTTALHTAVRTLGVRGGDEVIVPAFTWVSTANCVEYEGAHPVFVDIDLETFNIDAAAVEDVITERTVGMVPVHLFGLTANCDALRLIADRNSLWMVEDAACAFDATWNGKAAGTHGEIGCFSFHPRKVLTTGEGGMLVTNRAGLAQAARTLRSHGVAAETFASAGSLGHVQQLGYNYRMTDLQGALGCTQLAKADWIMAQRRMVAAWYDEALSGIDVLRPPPRHANEKHGWQAYVCLIQPETLNINNITAAWHLRNQLIAGLEEQGIGSRAGTHAPAHLEYYSDKYGIAPEDFPNAWIAERCSIALPLSAGMTEQDVGRVRDAIVRVLSLASMRHAA